MPSILGKTTGTTCTVAREGRVQLLMNAHDSRSRTRWHPTNHIQLDRCYTRLWYGYHSSQRTVVLASKSNSRPPTDGDSPIDSGSSVTVDKSHQHDVPYMSGLGPHHSLCSLPCILFRYDFCCAQQQHWKDLIHLERCYGLCLDSCPSMLLCARPACVTRTRQPTTLSDGTGTAQLCCSLLIRLLNS